MINIFRIILFIVANIYIICVGSIPFARANDTKNILIANEIYKSGAILFNRSLGFNKPIVIDYRKYKLDANIVVFQHNNFIDGVILFEVFGKIAMLLNSKYKKIPMIKHVEKMTKSIVFIERGKKGNSAKITNFIKNNPESYLGIAPTGGKDTFDDLIGHFTTGAFVPMKPVIPVLMRYRNTDGTWYNADGSDKWQKEWLIESFSKNKDVEITLLEEVGPDEGMTPREYADKVEKIMREYNEANPAFS